MFKRIKRLIKLSSKDPKALEALTEEQIDSIPEAGDGNAEFFGEGTEEEFLDQERAEVGLKAWYDRIKQ